MASDVEHSFGYDLCMKEKAGWALPQGLLEKIRERAVSRVLAEEIPEVVFTSLDVNRCWICDCLK